MERSIISIDSELCVGCSLCVNACTQDALQMIDGKAVLVNDSYCDGLGMCLPQCPVNAITISTKETGEFKQEKANIKLKESENQSALNQWPVQLHLVRENADFFKNSNLLIAADCIAFASANIHNNLIFGKSIAIACPKLDDTSYYTEKIANIIKLNNIKTITVAIMEVPCCNKLKNIAYEAIELSGINVPIREVVVGINGNIL